MKFDGSLAKHKRVFGIALALLVIAVVFVPWQRASAFTIDTDFPNQATDATSQKALGEDFNIVVTVEAGELISISKITLILDNGQSGVKLAKYDSNGDFVTGDGSFIIGNDLDITFSKNKAYGYGYGYGYLADGYSYSAPYAYNNVNPGNGYVGGNTLGYAYSGTSSYVNGLIGPGTITISGTLKTGTLSSGSHTLDALVDTGAAGGNDQLVAPQFAFTVTANSNVVTTPVTASSSPVTKTITAGGSTVTINFGSVTSGGTIVVEKTGPSALSLLINNIFTNVFTSTSTATLNLGSTDTGLTVGPIFDIDISSITTSGTFDVTIPYDPSLIPSDQSESDVRFLHWTGSTWEDVTLSVDVDANTVTGRLSSLSPVVAGVLDSLASTSSGTHSTTHHGGGGGGGGGGGPVVVGPSLNDFTTYPDSYFALHPLSKIVVLTLKFLNAQGTGVQNIAAGDSVQISGSFKNYQEHEQPYAFIIQVTDSSGATVSLDYRMGTLPSGQSAILATTWTAEESDVYTVKVFVWDGLGEAPSALSQVNTGVLNVS